MSFDPNDFRGETAAEYHADLTRIDEARRAAAARSHDIAALRTGYTTFVQQFASAADRLYIDAAFIALEHLEGDAYEIAYGALDEKIDALDRAADAERSALLRMPGGIENAVALAWDGWLGAQRIAASLAGKAAA
jgi:hypothetical protein